jgi:DNA-binding XRE family transcriptional regulator
MENFEKKELLETFSTELRKARIRLDLTQATVAHETGLSTRGYQKIENGEADPQLTTVTAIASALNTPISALLGRETTSDLIVDIIIALPTMNEKQLKSVLGLISAALAPVTNSRL